MINLPCFNVPKSGTVQANTPAVQPSDSRNKAKW